MEEKKTQSAGLKALLIILFILSLGSLYFALMIVAISIESSPIPSFYGVMLEHMWKFFLIVPLPLTSTILGIIYIRKGYKCKKNIIAGIIMTAFLCIYGSFSGLSAETISHDFEYAQALSSIVNIDIPADSYVAYTEKLFMDDKALLMVKISDSSQSNFIKALDTNDGWKRDIAHIPANAVDIFTLSSTSDYDYFAVYNESKGIYSDYDGKLIFMAYDVETSVLYVTM